MTEETVLVIVVANLQSVRYFLLFSSFLLFVCLLRIPGIKMLSNLSRDGEGNNKLIATCERACNSFDCQP
jgi:hypothetical protein